MRAANTAGYDAPIGLTADPVVFTLLDGRLCVLLARRLEEPQRGMFALPGGFVGSSVLLLLYLLVVWRGLRVITVAGDLYGAVVAGALVCALMFQIFVNAGMTMGIAPVTGIPLPFIAVGGSSLVTNLVLIGVLQGIHARGLLAGRQGA